MTKRAIMISVLMFFLIGTFAIGIDVKDTQLLNQAAISRNHIAFIYAEDLWVADTDGSNVRRLTTVRGPESEPVFSPDGNWIAFSAQYDGNMDVFVVPVDGGVPKRLTWHPGDDIVRDFTPDGSAVLFISQREVFTNRYYHLFTVSLNGGFPEKLPIPNAFKAKYSPDGQKIAYTPIFEPFQQWKRYRGGRVSTIWIYTRSDHSVLTIPQPEGRCNDTDPMWIGNTVYFRSDRNGEFNLFSFDRGISNYMLSGDKKKMTFSALQSVFIVPTGKIQSGQGRINIDAFELLINPRAEWKQMLRETWRINRDYFYDPHMHGVDWDAVWKKYEVFLPHLACRSDLNRLIRWMLSELAVGHSYSGGGDFRDRPKRVPGGLLGADYTIENGHVAYVYVPNTSFMGHIYFKRYFFPQSDKDAIIVDERFNGGGSLADYYIDILRRPLIAHWAMRYGADLKTPSASIQGPKVMIIDETAGSGGDLLPWMFRKFKLGTLVGKRTWGGLVGILGFPPLMDGGFVTAPNLAIWSDDGWVVENEGVPPDIEVEQWPADVIAGRDPQLEKAIEIVMDELKKNPPKKWKRPSYPKR